MPGEPFDLSAPLELPEPCVVLLVGAAGSGKSTLASRLFAADRILSSDAYRGIVSGDAADQSVTRVAFKLLQRELERRLRARLTTVVDATNVTSHARRSVLRVAVAHGIPVVAIVLDLDPALVHAQNATRPGRIVPSQAVDAQLRDLARSLRHDALGIEGYAVIRRLRTTAEVDALSFPLAIPAGRPGPVTRPETASDSSDAGGPRTS